MKPKNYLVTGGCGFIGSHLVAALHRTGHSVCVIDDLSNGRRSSITSAVHLSVADIRHLDDLKDLLLASDGCFHLAAVASVPRCNEAWLDSHQTNASALVGLLDLVREKRGEPIPFVYASSAAVYGDNPSMPLSEAMSPRPLSAYAVDKLACELHAAVGARIHGLSSLGLRFFNVYGKGQASDDPYSGVITIFKERLRKAETISIFGDGRQYRDFIHVSDVVGALIRAMNFLHCNSTKPVADVVNICTGEKTSIIELLTIMSSALSTQCEVQHLPPRAADIFASLGDPGKAKGLIGFAATKQIAEGLQELLLS